MDKLRQLKKYPIMVLFFLFLAMVMVVDMLVPDQVVSEFENRPLQQSPAFTLDAFLENEWTLDYGEYIRDQFVFRDAWVSFYGALEMAQGKLEDGGVWFAEDGCLIAANSSWSNAQERLLPVNTETIGTLAAAFPGKVQAMIVPSPANILSEKLPQFWQPYQVDENGMMDSLFSQLAGAGAGTIDLRAAFNAADGAGEQVYYRTDHHWTTDVGARMAYEAYCEAVGKTPLPPDESLRVAAPGFFGTNYSKTKRPGVQPDTLVYYDLPNRMSYDEPQTDGSFITHTGQPLMDAEKLEPMDKYAAFLHGNNRFSTIEGSGEGKVLLIKDSYGNSFAPYLAANYAQVDVLDLRGWVRGESVLDFIAAGGYDDILVLYSFASFTTDTGIRYMGT